MKAASRNIFAKKRQLGAGALLLALILLFSVAAPWLTPYSPDSQNLSALHRHQPPSLQHPFGTDQFGRDVFTRVLFGGRISLAIGMLVVILSMSLGTLYGAVSGYMGGAWDAALMRLVDVLLAFPFIFFAVTAIALFGSNLPALVLILALTGWMETARVVRAEILSLKTRAFILKARAAGLNKRSVILRHLIPNTFALVAAASALRVADVILLESTLSFLGVGVQPPTASWGTILNDGRPVLATAWWLTLFPGSAIALTTIGFHLMGEALPAPGKSA